MTIASHFTFIPHKVTITKLKDGVTPTPQEYLQVLKIWFFLPIVLPKKFPVIHKISADFAIEIKM